MSKDRLPSPNIAVFDQFALEYDEWFIVNNFAYLSETEAIRRFIPDSGLGVEIGTGTGRFSIPFGIRVGIEPAAEMARIAKSRGIYIARAVAEELPFADNTIDYILMVTTICFLTDLRVAFKEIHRVLKPGGRVIIGFIDRESPLGEKYELMKEASKFYKGATFYSVSQVMNILSEAGFSDFQICQTIFTDSGNMNSFDPVEEGHGKGGFAVISCVRKMPDCKT